MEDKTPSMSNKYLFPGSKYRCLNDQLQHFKSIIADATKPPERDEELAVVRYWMLCGDPRSDEPMKSFTFLETAPRIICQPSRTDIDVDKSLRDLPEDFQNWMGFSKDLFSKYNSQVQNSQPSPCVVCQKPATATRSTSWPLLGPEPGSGTDGFIPMAVCFGIPVCPRSENGGVCSDTGYAMSQKYGLQMMLTNPCKNWDLMKTCQKCGSTANIQLCGGCKLIGYVNTRVKQRYVLIGL